MQTNNLFFRRVSPESKALFTCCPGLTVGNTSATASRSPARSARATGAPKLNVAALAADLLLTGRANVMYNESDDTIYCEFRFVGGGKVFQALCRQGESVDFLNELPAGGSDLTSGIPIAFYAMFGERGGDFLNTRDTARNLLAAWSAIPAGTSMEDTTSESYQKVMDALFLLSDNFYYEGVSSIYPTSTDLPVSLSPSKESETKQAIRTSQMKPLDWSSVSNIDFPAFVIPVTVTESAPASTSVPEDDMFTRAKRGEFLIPHLWDPERQVYIPSLEKLNDYIPVPKFYSMLSIIKKEIDEILKRMDEDPAISGLDAIGKNYLNFQLIGRPGTGKTTLVQALAAALGFPVRMMNCSKNTEEDAFEGKTVIQNGAFASAETAYLDGYVNGGVVLMEEYNLMDPAVIMGATGQALVPPFITMKDGYKEVYRHHLCIIIGTMNTGTQGSHAPNQAFSSRLPHIFRLGDPTRDDFLKILESGSGATRRDCIRVYDVYTRVLNFLLDPKRRQQDIALGLTMRHCLAALEEMRCGIPFKEALDNTIIGAIAPMNVELAEQAYEGIVAGLPDR